MAPIRPKASTKGRKRWGRGKSNHFESRTKRNRKIPRLGINRIERNRTERSSAERQRAERNKVEKSHAVNSIAEKYRAEKQLPWRPPRPLAILAQKHELALSRKALFPQSGPSAASKKPKPVITKSRHGLAKYKPVAQWPSPEPLEMNCLERAPLPPNYVFVPRGDVYVTRHCRSKTKEDHRLVYKVYDNTGKKALGIRVPADVHAAVLRSAEETAESRANAVRARDERELAHNRELLRKQFPLMPAQSLNTILQHAFLKGSGRVGRTTTTPEKEKVILAVEAHIRHVHTPYEELLRSGMPRLEARNKLSRKPCHTTLTIDLTECIRRTRASIATAHAFLSRVFSGSGQRC
ncbi:DUF2293 domain-containing protein [Aspergillus nidulans FGSC A4]|uniref:DUF2293 domain-containing protein n=1 Tax=Emericella nidulans (strain FGSC A4 / ATCC 38163 / CBS 112.46 / NRRL 194 / M139) TaxID=227321 RepID=C8VU83_EMENI|nr:hypothetical protein [Aspergillus nidulans FGSC A4]CBF88393.1 TPA: conserved hypothetical protein [Aspergillus nidulans FGSC A4]